MRTLILSCSLLITSAAFAQLTTCLHQTPQAAESKSSLLPSEQSSLVQKAVRTNRRSAYQPALGISQFMVDGDSRTAPSIGVSYVPTTKSPGKLTFSGGIVWLPRSSSGMYNPPFSGFGRFQFNRINNQYSNSSSSLALGYFGAEYRYYLMQGAFQPYVGGGAQFLGWKYGAGWGTTVAPSVLGGASVEISTVFSGYVELRQLVGLGTIAGNSRFGGSTMFSAGFAFAPNFSSW